MGFYFAINDWWLYGIPLSIIIGFISYQFIEKINFKRYNSLKDFYKVIPIYFSLTIFILGFLINKTNGMIFHYSEELMINLKEVNNKNDYRCMRGLKDGEIDECYIGNKHNIQAVIIGDSHANSILTAVSAIYDLKKEGLVSITTSSCPFLIGAKFNDKNNKCQQINEKRLDLIESNKYKDIPIILASRLPAYIYGQNEPERIKNDNGPSIYFNEKKIDLNQNLLNSLTETICKIKSNNPVYIIQPVPEMPFNVPKSQAKNVLLNLKKPLIFNYSEYLQRSASIRNMIFESANVCQAQVLDPAEILCDKISCMYEYNNRAIYFDGDHLSEYGNKLLVPMFKNAFKEQ